jgi:cytochrome c-type biogenesis protein CcmH
MFRNGCLLLCAALWLAGPASAKEAVPVAADPVLEARVLRITTELRCLVCQNQTVADSHSGLADDLRREVREQLQRGASDAQVVQFMTDRYGDFVRYRPALKGSTVLLWAGPAALLLVGLGALALVLRRRAKLAPDRFEEDSDADDPWSEASAQSPGRSPR